MPPPDAGRGRGGRGGGDGGGTFGSADFFSRTPEGTAGSQPVAAACVPGLPGGGGSGNGTAGRPRAWSAAAPAPGSGGRRKPEWPGLAGAVPSGWKARPIRPESTGLAATSRRPLASPCPIRRATRDASRAARRIERMHTWNSLPPNRPWGDAAWISTRSAGMEGLKFRGVISVFSSGLAGRRHPRARRPRPPGKTRQFRDSAFLSRTNPSA
ncbi:hypothetical protein CAL14_03870 [Bordetella genomosp. 9]|nr:hypothetical protein CAL14_03870 [Bordetella genomosp. 9]